ncbi:MAG TPA: hypothetical protein PLO84_14100, partial [Thermotogota bacterium]|nr:hypothetical protein [Thermotogota bacterium]
ERSISLQKDKIKALINRTYFIGGSPCSGKSTVSELLSQEYLLHYYKVDDHDSEHLKRIIPEKHPLLCKWQNPNWNELWMRPVEIQVGEEFQIYRERFEMIMDDLLSLPEDHGIIVEGAALIPDLMQEYKVPTDRLIYMIPTKDFQVKKYSEREFIKYILAECNEPDTAFKNWMERDHQFGQIVTAQAKVYGYKILSIDGSTSIENTISSIKRHFFL